MDLENALARGNRNDLCGSGAVHTRGQTKTGAETRAGYEAKAA